MMILSESKDRLVNPDYIMQTYIKHDEENNLYVIEAELQSEEIVRIGSYRRESDAKEEFALLAKGDEKARRNRKEWTDSFHRFIDDLLNFWNFHPKYNHYVYWRMGRF